MKKEILKTKPFIITLFVLVPFLIVTLFTHSNLQKDSEVDPEYITEETLNETVPVLNEKEIIINPYIGENITIGKNYYDYQAEEETQKNSIVVHDNTYMQNTGIDYTSKNVFDVVSILEGTVINIKDDETIGKIIEIKHANNLVSSYQSLSEITVKKGDVITQGQVIGKSGSNELDKDLGNHLHFEIYDNGQAVNPNNYLNKELQEKKN